MTPTPVQCINCTRFSLRGHTGMASQGYGQCALAAGAGHFESAVFQRHCADFEAVAADVAERRRQWLDAKQKTFHEAIERSKAP
ncbi:hypothetical protein [uncultured Castellaniella sp.]|uniref:hypothetical protein n=1 Tax=uncultured Castellaniella sp. TaxID=647907 RepID=UPI00260E3C4F|nr:hypothetical protein [uncultured Castellaniella sp.]